MIPPEKFRSDRYQLLEPLGAGSSGRVLKALDRETQRVVALKFLPSGYTADQRSFLRRELHFLSRLSHPNLVRVFDYLEGGASPTATGPFFSMEWVASPLYPDPALFIQLCQGLHYLHGRNLLHRDLKPSNLRVDSEGVLKILDLGLAVPILAGKSEQGLGTWQYAPPEIFWGEYSVLSDIFSAGAVCYELFSGRLPFDRPLSGSVRSLPQPPRLFELRPDLPEHFCDLIDRMIERDPGRRPSSTATLLSYLAQHSDTEIHIPAPQALERTLEKIPLVGREAELRCAQEFLFSSPRQPGARLLKIQGPMGVGRTRFLEELRWALQDHEYRCQTLPGNSPQEWDRLLGEFLGLPAPEVEARPKILPLFERFLAVAGDRPWALIWSDLHLRSELELERLQEFLSLFQTGPSPWVAILEYEALKFPIAPWENELTISLGDLDDSQALTLLRSVPLAQKLGPEREKALLAQGGGRPLLLLSSLQGGGPRRTPGSWLESIASQLKGLPEGARTLLSLLVAHSFPVPAAEANSLFPGSNDEWEEALSQLDELGWLRARSLDSPDLALSHGSLAQSYRQALGEERMRSAHQRWFIHLNSRASESVPAETIGFLADHALAGEQWDQAKKWVWKAAEAAEPAGDFPEALRRYRQWSPFAESAAEKTVLHAHLAYLAYRCGDFPKALDSYEEWFRYRIDDPSFLQKAKHRLYTGMTLLAMDRGEAAQERLEDCLRIADPGQHPAHRPYQARARLLLASQAEKMGHTDAAQAHLEAALELGQDIPELRGEAFKQQGDLERAVGNLEKALPCYRQSLEIFRSLGNTQGQAIALQAIGMTLRKSGRLSEALPYLQDSIELAKQVGEALPWARYRENLALLYLDMGEYGDSLALQSQTRPVLISLGTEEDRALVDLHRAASKIYLGQFRSAAELLSTFETGAATLPYLKSSAHHLRGELAYLEGDYESAETSFRAAARESERDPLARAWAEVGALRSRWRRGLAAETTAAPPACRSDLWDYLLPRYETTSERWEADAFLTLLKKIKDCEYPEQRQDTYELLALKFSRAGHPGLSGKFSRAAACERSRLRGGLQEETRMDFEKSRGGMPLDQEIDALLPEEAARPAPRSATGPREGRAISEARFRQISALGRRVSEREELADTLSRIMDAAIEFTGAQRGFLLLKNESCTGGPIPDFEVHCARGIPQGSLGGEGFQLSRSAVRIAVDTGAPLLTDNAQLDPRLKDRPSVTSFRLLSILVVPMETEGRVRGALYLDHQGEPERFSQEDVVLLTAFAAQAALAIQKAKDYEALNRSKSEIEARLRSQAEVIQGLNERLNLARKDFKYQYGEIIGVSQKMTQVFQLLEHVTETTIPVWIFGESGTGKELIARSLHFNSSRKNLPFVVENVSAIPESLLESELFGHKRGAFTHADKDRVGLFEQANGGTLFLDEIADMSLGMQAKLLRVLQDGEVRPLGSNKRVKIDVRLVTASNQDLHRLVGEGKFRQDLFFRINGLTIPLPPLRERKEDIPMLVEHMLEKFSRDFHLVPGEVTEQAYQALMRHAWPGNIRELENVIRNALLFSKGRPIGPDLVILQSPGKSPSLGRDTAQNKENPREALIDALKRHEMNKARAASELGISLRTLYNRLEEYRIPKKKAQLAEFLGLE
ncbi:MAG: sigma 54-interacting transcriptional regulator [bacterium]